jgi:hypothetical protein
VGQFADTRIDTAVSDQVRIPLAVVVCVQTNKHEANQVGSYFHDWRWYVERGPPLRALACGREVTPQWSTPTPRFGARVGMSGIGRSHLWKIQITMTPSSFSAGDESRAKATTVGVGTDATLSRLGTSLSTTTVGQRHAVRDSDLKENCAQCGVSRHKKAAQLWRHHRAGVARLTNASDIGLRRPATHAE